MVAVGYLHTCWQVVISHTQVVKREIGLISARKENQGSHAGFQPSCVCV